MAQESTAGSMEESDMADMLRPTSPADAHRPVCGHAPTITLLVSAPLRQLARVFETPALCLGSRTYRKNNDMITQIAQAGAAGGGYGLGDHGGGRDDAALGYAVPATNAAKSVAGHRVGRVERQSGAAVRGDDGGEAAVEAGDSQSRRHHGRQVERDRRRLGGHRAEAGLPAPGTKGGPVLAVRRLGAVGADYPAVGVALAAKSASGSSGAGRKRPEALAGSGMGIESAGAAGGGTGSIASVYREAAITGHRHRAWQDV